MLITQVGLEWHETFPQLVQPLANEWFGGFVLRCDEVNGWGGGTTLFHLKRGCGERRGTKPSSLNTPLQQVIDDLAVLLHLPIPAIEATTFLPQLRRLYGENQPAFSHLPLRKTLCICPACIDEQLFLHQSIGFLGMTVCPIHLLLLQRTCPCGNLIDFFVRSNGPFTCGHCHKSWATLPQRNAPSVQVKQQKMLLEWYGWILEKGSIFLFGCLQEYIAQRIAKRGAHEFLYGIERAYSLRYTHPQNIAVSILAQALTDYQLEVEEVTTTLG